MKQQAAAIRMGMRGRQTVQEETAADSGTEEAIWISDKEDFLKIYDDLTASYVLDADIDFGSYVEGITLSGENTVHGRFLIGGIAGHSMPIL